MSVDLRVGPAYVLILRGSDSVCFCEPCLYCKVARSLGSDLLFQLGVQNPALQSELMTTDTWYPKGKNVSLITYSCSLIINSSNTCKLDQLCHHSNALLLHDSGSTVMQAYQARLIYTSMGKSLGYGIARGYVHRFCCETVKTCQFEKQ